MVPPALGKVRETVLCAELNDFVKDRPEVHYEMVSEEEAGDEPVDPVDKVVVVEVFNETFESQVAVIVVSVHSALDLLVKAAVEEAEDLSSELGSLVEHEDEEAHVHQEDAECTADYALDPLVLHSLNVRIQIGKGRGEEQDRLDALPNAFFYYRVPLCIVVSWQVLLVVGVSSKSPDPNV